MNTLTIWVVWVQILSIAVGMIIGFVAVWRHHRHKLDPYDDPLKWRRNAGLLIYGLSAILSSSYMLNSNRPVYTLGDLAAWVFTFIALSILIWLVSASLVMRFLEKTS